MNKVTLTLCDLRSGDKSHREFDDEAATILFLKERPPFTDVLGVTFEGLTPEANARLREAMRPLDDEERALDQKLAEATRAAKDAERAERQKQEAALREASALAKKTADPNRQMEVRYVHGGELSLVDAEDGREITPEAREAVMAWVAERSEWVAPRGQIVADAKVMVWPGPLPKPGVDRVASGTFIPVSAPPS
jgi:hypothetical protein